MTTYIERQGQMTMTNPALDLFDAFRSTGMGDEKARSASDAVLRGDTARLDRIETRLDRIDGDVGQLKTDVSLLKWMVGINTGLTLLVLGILLRVNL
jgi:hypothetical protein